MTDAINVCNDNGTSTWDCIESAMHAASDCLVCVCEVAGGMVDVEVDGCDPKPDKTTTPVPLPVRP